MCWMPSFFVSLFSFDWFNSPSNFAAALIVEFIFGRLFSWLLTIFKNLSFFVFCFQVFCSINYLCFVYRFSMKQAPFSFFPFLYQLLGDAFFTLLVSFYFPCDFLVISSNLQLIIPKAHFNTGTTNAPVAVILFLAYKSRFSNILNIPMYSFCNLSFICYYCMLSFSSFPRYFYVFPFSSSCISLLKSSILFCEWTKFPLWSTNFVSFSRANSIWISSLNVLSACFCI